MVGWYIFPYVWWKLVDPTRYPRDVSSDWAGFAYETDVTVSRECIIPMELRYIPGWRDPVYVNIGKERARLLVGYQSITSLEGMLLLVILRYMG